MIDLLSDSLSQPRRVGLWDISQCQSGSLENKVVDTQLRRLVLLGKRLVEDLTKLDDLVHVNIDSEVVMRDVLLRLCQTRANSSSDVRNRNVDIIW